MAFQLLKVLSAEHRGRVLNRDQLLEFAHDRGWDLFDRSVDIRILRLRKKIEVDPSKLEVSPPSTLSRIVVSLYVRADERVAVPRHPPSSRA